jgi:hypothetical protein
MKARNGLTVDYVRSDEKRDYFKITGPDHENVHYEDFARDTITEEEILDQLVGGWDNGQATKEKL